MIGKRKRETIVVRRENKDDSPVEDGNPGNYPHDFFRKYFEAQFDPLPEGQFHKFAAVETSNEKDDEIESIQDDDEELNDEHNDTNDSSSEASEWSGISEEATNVPVVEVVEYGHRADPSETDPNLKALQKAFMSSVPPKDISRRLQSLGQAPTAEDEKEEQTNLKYDLDLQRLLRESHLLEQTKTSTAPGKQRHKATDMRLQDLGSKTSIFKQEKMPISHAVGIRKKAESKESQRRKHAQQNGIVLERSSKNNKSAPKRDRGVDMPGLGKFRGGTLKLSKADIASMQSPSRGGGRKKGRR